MSRGKSHKRASGHHSGACHLIAFVSAFLVARRTQISCSRARARARGTYRCRTAVKGRDTAGGPRTERNGTLCINTPRPSPRLARYDPVVSYTVRRAPSARRGATATKQGCDPGRSGRIAGEVIVRKNAPPRRQTTRSGIIFYEGIVSVLYIGSLTTRCSVAACAPSPTPPVSPPFPSLSHTVSPSSRLV